MRLKKHLVPEQLEFDGHQLDSGWARESFALDGESIVAFVGPFDPESGIVTFPSACQIFRKRRMLHLVVEHLHDDLEKLRLQQRLLLCVLKDKLDHRLKGDLVQRWDEELFHESTQITVSTSMLTTSSAVIYTGVNIQGGDSESKLWGLEDGGIDALELAQVVVDQYVFEIEGTRRQRG